MVCSLCGVFCMWQKKTCTKLTNLIPSDWSCATVPVYNIIVIKLIVWNLRNYTVKEADWRDYYYIRLYKKKNAFFQNNILNKLKYSPEFSAYVFKNLKIISHTTLATVNNYDTLKRTRNLVLYALYIYKYYMCNHF